MAELVAQMGDGALDELIRSLGESYGENARMASTMADNIGGDLKNLKSAWEGRHFNCRHQQRPNA